MEVLDLYRKHSRDSKQDGFHRTFSRFTDCLTPKVNALEVCTCNDEICAFHHDGIQEILDTPE